MDLDEYLPLTRLGPERQRLRWRSAGLDGPVGFAIRQKRYGASGVGAADQRLGGNFRVRQGRAAAGFCVYVDILRAGRGRSQCGRRAAE